MKRNIFLMSGIICLAVSAMTTVHAQSAETVKSSADGQAPDGQHGKNMFVDGDFESQAKALCANATADKVHDDAVPAAVQTTTSPESTTNFVFARYVSAVGALQVIVVFPAD